RPTTRQAMKAVGVYSNATATVARVSVALVSPLTLTSTFQIPCRAAAASASAIATGIKARGSAARRDRRGSSRAGEETAQEPVDLRVDDQPVVAAPNRDRRDVGPDAAAEVHDVV